MRAPRVIVCSCQSAPDVTRRTTYEQLRAAVLEAGRFSAFEAMANTRAASMFTRLCRDPSLETRPLAFPWTSVRQKPSPQEKAP